MRISLLPVLALLGLSGCIDVHEHKTPPQSTTVVTPSPAPTATYVAPERPGSTVVRTP